MSMPTIKSLSLKANIPLNRIVIGKVGKFENWAVIVTEITCSDDTIERFHWTISCQLYASYSINYKRTV